MPIEKIDPELCTGCGLCIQGCPMDVLRLDEVQNLAVIRYPEDCMLCGWCLIDCPEEAITVTPEKSAPLIVSWG